MRVDTASESDIEEILTLILEVSAWLKTKGIHQWGMDYPKDQLLQDVKEGNVFVSRDEGRIVATLSLSPNAGEVWTQHPGEALYLHRLALVESQRGTGMADQLIRWAEGRTRRKGKACMRLDCDDKNVKLRNYYEKAGFRLIGTEPHPAYGMNFALYEKGLSRK